MPISLSGSLNLSGSLTTTGTITATTLVVQTITSSISSVTGSTNFGSLAANTHTFTGSVNITGSQTISNGDLTISGNRNIFLSNANTAAGVIRFYNSTSGSTKSAIGSYYNIADEGNLEFLTGGTSTRMVITSAGNVGIGTSTMSQTLSGYTQVDIGNPATGGALLFSNGSGTSYGYINGASSGLNLRSVVGDLTFNVNNAERMRISGSNVGIGITTPSQPLHVYATTTTTSTFFETNAANSYIGLKSTSGTNYIGNVSFAMTFEAGGAERMRITSAGNVGIGTASPATSYGFSRFLVISNPTNAEISLEATTSGKVLSMGVTNGWNYFQTTAGNGYDFQIGGTSRFVISSTGAISTSSTISAGGNISMAQFYASALFSSYTGDGLFNAASRYCAISTPGAADRIRLGYNDYGSGQYWGRIGFAATNNWSLGIIGAAGNDFSIGTGYQGVQFYIYANGNYDFTGSDVSDRRKKTNINYITTNQLDNILKLKPVTFNKITDEVVNENIHTGFIAQDVLESGIPNLVMGSDEGGYGLDYNGILSLAVKAIQELTARVQELENK
jgi:hypothetical protein